ncbi:hypothetical protein ACLOJK_010483 [Asimina triloba]
MTFMTIKLRGVAVVALELEWERLGEARERQGETIESERQGEVMERQGEAGERKGKAGEDELERGDEAGLQGRTLIGDDGDARRWGALKLMDGKRTREEGGDADG